VLPVSEIGAPKTIFSVASGSWPPPPEDAAEELDDPPPPPPPQAIIAAPTKIAITPGTNRNFRILHLQ